MLIFAAAFPTYLVLTAARFGVLAMLPPSFLRGTPAISFCAHLFSWRWRVTVFTLRSPDSLYSKANGFKIETETETCLKEPLDLIVNYTQR